MSIRLPIVSTFDPQGINRAQSALRDFGRFASDIGKVAAGAVAAVGVAGVREAMNFESSIAKIEGLVGVTGSELDYLAQSARRLGPEFGKSANEAAEAMFFIASAGLRGESAVNVLEASLKGAAIGLGDTKTIADLATSAVNAYGEAQLDGAQAVNILAEAVRLGKLEPAELAQSMGQVLPLASNLGITFDEVGAAMAGMSKTGTDAATGATQLRQIMATLAKPTAEAEQALAEMGLSAEGLRQEILDKGFFSALETLTEGFDGNIEATTQVFGNIRALSGVLDLMGASVDDNRELFRLMGDDIYIADEAMQITADTAEFKFNEAMAKTKDTLLGIGQDLLERLLPYLDRFNTFMEENGPQIQEAFDKIYGAVDTVVTRVGDFLADLIADPDFNEFLVSMRDHFDEIYTNVGNVIENLGRMSGDAIPTLTGTIENSFQILEDLSSIFDDISYFAAEINTGLGGMDENVAIVVDAFARALNPFGHLTDTLHDLRDAINDVRRAWERFKEVTGMNFGSRIPVPSDARDAYVYSGRANGGAVTKGRPYVVGERGPELFVPQIGGNIVPNGKMGSGGNNYNYTVNVTAGVGDPIAIGQEVVRTIKRYERANGPVFASA